MSKSLIFDEISTWQAEATQLRHRLHQFPEIGFNEINTQKLIIEQLTSYGVDEINTQFAKTGVVAVIHGNQSGPAIGLRADIDALPITEQNHFEHKSNNNNKMHACGHDGHTTMLLMAAKYLCLHRNFPGKAILFFCSGT
ncbi:M20 metallopeptidase family protein, partial [Gallibacterium genomosp. 3]